MTLANLTPEHLTVLVDRLSQCNLHVVSNTFHNEAVVPLDLLYEIDQVLQLVALQLENFK